MRKTAKVLIALAVVLGLACTALGIFVYNRHHGVVLSSEAQAQPEAAPTPEPVASPPPPVKTEDELYTEWGLAHQVAAITCGKIALCERGVIRTEADLEHCTNEMRDKHICDGLGLECSNETASKLTRAHRERLWQKVQAKKCLRKGKNYLSMTVNALSETE